MLASLAITGRGVWINSALQMREMEIVLHDIGVSPFKALMGNIQLTQPSQGKACFLLSETDIAGALKIEKLQQQLAKYRITLDGQPVIVEVQGVRCRLGGDRPLEIHAQFILHPVNTPRTVSLWITPRVCTTQRSIILDDYRLGDSSEPQLSPIVLQTLLAEADHILNLQDFQIDGFSLQIQDMAIAQGQLQLHADVGMTYFPVRSSTN
jgi:hypothetical protein